MLAKLLAILGPVKGTLKGVINTDEFIRIFGTSLAAGLVAAAIGVVTAVQSDLSNIIDVPFLVGPAAMLLTQLLDTLRRLQHGADVPG